jgi:phosphohistidine phosphatase
MSTVPHHYYTQSAVIPVRERAGQIEILLITSRKKKRWVLPKGVKEPELSLVDSAAKEALEEAGIEGKIMEPAIGRYDYEKWGGVCNVQVFVMRVEKVHPQWQEAFRDRAWLSVEDAAQRVREDALQQLIRSVSMFLASHQPDTSASPAR